MDYLEQPFWFKVKKVLRYASLYGVNRTYYKTLGQLHLRRTYRTLPTQNTKPDTRQWIGLIGCGNYAYTTIAYYLNKVSGRAIAACMDIDINRAASLAQRYRIPCFTTDAEEIINADNIRLIYIASNHATHAEYAIAALQRGKNVYIEKPHVVTMDQLRRLNEAATTAEGRIFLGFNRPGSRFGQIIQAHLNVESGPGMYNWFVAGHDIDPGHWYFHPAEGGRVLGNLCHWTDFVLRLAGNNAFPIRINPTRAKSSDSDIAVTFTFGDGTIAAITFSAKGHTFEGVKESFHAHRGNCLLSMKDFKTLQIEIGDSKKRFHNFYRDHGHRRNIVSAANNVMAGDPYDRNAEITHLANTGLLFLKTKEALDGNKEIMIKPFGENE